MIRARRENRIRNGYQKTPAVFPSRRGLWWAGGVLVVLLAAGAGWILYRGAPGNLTPDSSPTVRELQARIDNLRATNQKLREKNRSLSWKLHQLTSKETRESDGTTVQRDSSSANASPDKPLPTEGPGEERKENPDEWINVVGLSYPLRGTLLRKPIYYQVGPQDTLTKLAHQYYHRSGYWKAIYRANRDVLSSPDVLPAGTKLRLPPMENLSGQ